RRPEALDLAPEDARRYQLNEGDRVRVSSRRGSVIAPVRFDSGLRPGLAFLSVHFHEQVATNDLTIEAVDPKSGTSEFKPTEIRIEPLARRQGACASQPSPSGLIQSKSLPGGNHQEN